MLIDPVALSYITNAVTLLAPEYAKGLAGEAGKATWTGIKALLGWQSDPPAAEIPERVAAGLSNSPEVTEKLLALIKQSSIEPAASLVQNLTITGGKVVIAQTIQNLTM